MRNIHVTAEEMRRIDGIAIEEFKMPSILLMENAGRGVADVVLRMSKEKKNSKVAIFCGKGNNGGDGLVAARHLVNNGIGVDVYLLAKKSELKNDPLVNFNILTKLTKSIKSICDLKSFNKIKEDLKNTDIIIDAMFGTGLASIISEPHRSIIKYLNKLNIPIVSIDVPSGLDATEGKVLGAAVRADKTATLCLPKKGFLKNEGLRHTGEVVVCDISIPRPAINKVVKMR